MAGIWHDMASKSLAVKKNHLKHKESPSGKKHSEKKITKHERRASVKTLISWNGKIVKELFYSVKSQVDSCRMKWKDIVYYFFSLSSNMSWDSC